MLNDSAEKLIATGRLAERAGRPAEAERCYREAAALDPDDAGLLHFLGLFLHRSGRPDEGLELVRRAAEAAPDVAEFQNNHGTLLAMRGQQRPAAAAFGRAIALRPGFAAAHANLGSSLRVMGRLGEAAAAFRRAIELEPGVSGPYTLLAMALSEMGDTQGTLASCRRAVELEPNDAGHHSGMLFALMHDGASTPESIYAETLAWAKRHAGGERLPGLRPPPLPSPGVPREGERVGGDQMVGVGESSGDARTLTLALSRRTGRGDRSGGRTTVRARLGYANDRSPDRRLRIGYVSADFREHTRARFVAPVLEHHDRERFEVFCYSAAVRPDRLTEWFRKTADHWREIRGKPDAAVAATIARDGIDILVELTGHMGGNRLRLFAMKPAPVQVAYPGYPATTGLRTIDGLLTDAERDPFGVKFEARNPKLEINSNEKRNSKFEVGSLDGGKFEAVRAADEFYTEPLIRLPVTSQCYRPPGDVPEVGALPGLKNGRVTFGMTNKLAKLTGPMAGTWARILGAVPGSRLLAVVPASPADQETVRRFLASHGVPADRVDLVGRSTGRAYFELYNRIDIALDTYPYNGHTTTLDGLWMGVPAVTLAGDAHVSREGLAICRLLGLDHLIARTEAEYKAIAIRLATDLPRLSRLRGELRAKMAASPLRDEVALTRRVEAAYRELWRAWCRSE